MKTLVAIQARSESKRFPKKIYKEIEGKPILLWVYEAAKRANPAPKAVEVMVAVIGPTGDSELETFCKDRNMPYLEGHPDDLIKRYTRAIEHFNADAIVRLTGDCPMMDTNCVTQCILDLMTSDYSSNTIHRTFPEGMDVQGCSREALKWFDGNQKEEREHPFKLFDENQTVRNKFYADKFTYKEILNAQNPAMTKTSIDTEDDLRRVNTYVTTIRAKR